MKLCLKFKKIITPLFLVYVGFFFNSGCVPKDVALSKELLDSIINGGKSSQFVGLSSAQTLSATKVQLSWEMPSDPSIVAYNIYDTTLMFNPVLVKTVKAPASSTSMTNLTSQTFYSFRVRAVTADQVEDKNVVDKGAIPYGGIIDATVVNASTVKVRYNDASNGDVVRIYCKVGIAATSETLLKEETNTQLTETSLTNLQAGESYVCRAVMVIGDFEDNNTETISFVPLGEATQLVFSTQPSSGAAGEVLQSQPVISIQDANGNVITAGPDANAKITLTISVASPTTGAIRGTVTVTAAKGVATFNGINIQEAGDKIMTATKSDTSTQTNGSSSFTADSNQFSIAPGAISLAKSSLFIDPAVPPALPNVADGNSSYQVVFILKDQYGNPVSGVKPKFSSSISGDILSQPTVGTDATGMTTGSINTIISDSLPPYRILSVSSPAGLSTLTTGAPFVPGSPSKLSFSVQPSNSPGGTKGMAPFQVSVVDANGNIINSGVGSDSIIQVSISSNINNATLSGTTSVQAVNGVAIFSDLGIDKTATGYKLVAVSGAYLPAYSNSFNITAGTPQKITIAGASSVISGSCSSAITIQLQDNGGNPANAIQNMPVTISGLGSASLYNNVSCSGSALGANMTFTAGTNLKTVYLKDNAGEAVNFSVKDTSNILKTGTKTVQVLPNKINLLANMPAPPAPVGTAMYVAAGLCSPALYVTPTGENGVAAPLFDVTTVSITGLITSSAKLYSDVACTQEVDPSNVSLPVTASGLYPIPFFIKDDKAELLYMNVSDPTGVMQTMSAIQPVTVMPSDILFSGPASVVAGKCSTAFTIKLIDKLGNDVAVKSATAVKINGLSGSTTGKFYASANCSGAAITSQVTIPQNNSSISIYFSDTNAETLNLYLSDSLGVMNSSGTLTIKISPAALKVTGPAGGNSKTSVCAGPFTINTLDGATPTPNVTSAIGAITVNLAHSGYATGFSAAGVFYSDSVCKNSISSVTFNSGENAKNFYFVGQYPITTMTVTASDAASVLTSGSTTWTVKADKGWLGTAGSDLADALGDFINWFQVGVQPVSARQDAPSTVRDLHFDSTKTFLYVVDQNGQRVFKYDYVNKRYVGWIGGFTNPNNAAAFVRGSSHNYYPDVPSAALCVSTTSGQMTPGWCWGGQSFASSNNANGVMYTPQRVTDDGTYIYVTNYNGHTVTRYNAASGAFDGWIGRVSSTPTKSGTGAPQTCSTTASGSQTPGWCIGGTTTLNASGSGNWGYGNGGLVYPRAIATDGTYLYVGNAGSINKYSLATGEFLGWIGKAFVSASAPVLAAPTAGASGCTSLTNGTTTPGWCVGGGYYIYNPRTTAGAGSLMGGINYPTDIKVINGVLFVVHTDSGGTISKYDADSGAFLGILPNTNGTWSPFDLVTVPSVSDPTNRAADNFVVADNTRIITADQTGTVLGWLGKVSNNGGMSTALNNPLSCSNLEVNANTPGWCLGGTAKAGLDEQAFEEAYAIEYDGNGHILAGQLMNPSIKMFDYDTGAYKGTLVYSSNAPTTWSTVSNLDAEFYGFGDGDFYSPLGVYSDGTFLYVADTSNGRIKKISLASGQTIGWIGVVTTKPTGGTSTDCLTANPMSVTPGWCTGAMPNPWSIYNFAGSNVSQLSGSMYTPIAITGDGTYIYVVDQGQHKILKFNASTGAFAGWIGKISTPPTGGAAGCVGAASGTFTPGWCTGGNSTSGTGDGKLYNPNGIVYMASTGNLYVTDAGNHRVVAYNASTGAFKGWIGRINTAPTSGCTTGSNGSYNVSTSGWCLGGDSTSGAQSDRGGGFYFWSAAGGITTDGTYLYVSNYYNWRIDKYSTDGVFQGSVNSRFDIYTNAWVPADQPANISAISGYYVMGIWADSTHIYGLNYYSTGGGSDGPVVFKLNIASGTVVGWHGAILPGNLPVDGESGCAGATTVTPGWCKGGVPMQGFRLGQFSAAHYITGDNAYIYITDVNNHRVTRIPK